MPTTRIDVHEQVVSVDQETLAELVDVIYVRCLKLAMDVRQPEEISSIHSRPKDGEATWLGPDGKGIWLESEALIQLEREEAEAETEGK